MTAPTDSFASIAEWLRAHGDNSTADRIERLDAEMRKELSHWRELADAYLRRNADLRARLAACERVLNEIIGDGCSPEEGMEVLCERTRQRCWGYFNPATRASVPKDAATGNEGKGGSNG
jgi:hypothetical protein